MDMNTNMIEIEMVPFVKCLILKVGLFETEIIDERNFSIFDEKGLLDFESKYCDDINYVSVTIDMWLNT